METRVTLVDWPQWPIETVYFLWEAARHNNPVQSIEEIRTFSRMNPEFKAKVRETFEKVIDSAIPIAENLNFTFLLEGVSISFREQMVRHKIGVKVGERLGVDMFPDIHDSTFWVQSMRVLDMGKFVDNDLFRMPESIAENPNAKAEYLATLKQCQDAYKVLLGWGVPIEDAREVIPLGAQHRLSWTLNLSALMHIAKKRSCWIPQIGTWGPVIEGMVNELATHVDPYFRSIVTPPCMKGDEFVGCKYKLDNERRVDREDPLLPCPLYLYNEDRDGKPVEERAADYRGKANYSTNEEKFGKLWGRDTETGRRKNGKV